MNGRWQRSPVVAVAFVVFAATTPWSSVAPAPPRVDLRVLLVGATGAEPSFRGWADQLESEGVPHDRLVAATAPDLTAAQLWDDDHAFYEAVILATSELSHVVEGGFRSAFTPEEWAVLDEFERRFAIRRVSAYAYPSSAVGLSAPHFSGSITGTAGSLTAAGRRVFPYLRGRVPIDTAWGHLAKPVTGAAFEPLVVVPSGEPVVGVHTRPDGREHLVMTVDSGTPLLHHRLLRTGILDWATRGVRLGHARSYLTIHVDDVFLANDRWDVDRNVTDTSGGRTLPLIAMTTGDVADAVAWSRRTGLRLDLAFNAVGAVALDAVDRALVANRSRFGWINHTYSHVDLDDAPREVIETEIARNLEHAAALGLPLRRDELVTGEHSGLDNPLLPPALGATGVRTVATDASREPGSRILGGARTVPRHPSNMYFNVGTVDEHLDEYNYLRFESCTQPPTCLPRPATWEEYVADESAMILGHVLQNDPRPHYVHQVNIAEDQVLYPVLDAVLKRYRSLLRLPLVQPTMTEIARLLARRDAWAAAVRAGRITGYRQGNLVRILRTGPGTIDAPVTAPLGTTSAGRSFGEAYGATASAWVAVGPRGASLTVPAEAVP